MTITDPRLPQFDCTEDVTVSVTFTPNTIGQHTIKVCDATNINPPNEVYVYYNAVASDVGNPVTVTTVINIPTYCQQTDIQGYVFADCDPEEQLDFQLVIAVMEETCLFAIMRSAVLPLRTIRVDPNPPTSGGAPEPGAGYVNGNYTAVPFVRRDGSQTFGSGATADVVIQNGSVFSISMNTIGDGYPQGERVPSTGSLQSSLVTLDPSIVGNPTTKAILEPNYGALDAFEREQDISSWLCGDAANNATSIPPVNMLSRFESTAFCADQNNIPDEYKIDGKTFFENCCCRECKKAIFFYEAENYNPEFANNTASVIYQFCDGRLLGETTIDYIDGPITLELGESNMGCVVEGSVFLANTKTKIDDSAPGSADNVFPYDNATNPFRVTYFDCDGPEVVNQVIYQCEDTAVPATYDLTTVQGAMAPNDPNVTFMYYSDASFLSAIANFSSYQNDINNKQIAVKVTDADGKTSAAFITLQYETPCEGGGGDENTPPEITSDPETTADVGETYTYNVTAVDADGDSITLEATDLPSWATFTDNGDGTGTITGTPPDAGNYNFTIVATDSEGDTDTQSWTVAATATGEFQIFNASLDGCTDGDNPFGDPVASYNLEDALCTIYPSSCSKGGDSTFLFSVNGETIENINAYTNNQDGLEIDVQVTDGEDTGSVVLTLNYQNPCPDDGEGTISIPDNLRGLLAMPRLRQSIENSSGEEVDIDAEKCYLNRSGNWSGSGNTYNNDYVMLPIGLSGWYLQPAPYTVTLTNDAGWTQKFQKFNGNSVPGLGMTSIFLRLYGEGEIEKGGSEITEPTLYPGPFGTVAEFTVTLSQGAITRSTTFSIRKTRFGFTVGTNSLGQGGETVAPHEIDLNDNPLNGTYEINYTFDPNISDIFDVWSPYPNTNILGLQLKEFGISMGTDLSFSNGTQAIGIGLGPNQGEDPFEGTTLPIANNSGSRFINIPAELEVISSNEIKLKVQKSDIPYAGVTYVQFEVGTKIIYDAPYNGAQIENFVFWNWNWTYYTGSFNILDKPLTYLQGTSEFTPINVTNGFEDQNEIVRGGDARRFFIAFKDSINYGTDMNGFSPNNDGVFITSETNLPIGATMQIIVEDSSGNDVIGVGKFQWQAHQKITANLEEGNCYGTTLVIDFLAGNQLSLGTYSIKILTSYFASNNPEQFIIEDGIVVI